MLILIPLTAFLKHRSGLTLASGDRDVAKLRELWVASGEESADPKEYKSSGQDLVEQMLLGFGWRVTGQHHGEVCGPMLTGRDLGWSSSSKFYI